jgi:hypothetical protein
VRRAGVLKPGRCKAPARYAQGEKTAETQTGIKNGHYEKDNFTFDFD